MGSSGNQLKTVILLGALTGILLWVGNLVGGPQGLTIAFVIVLLMNGISYWFSDKIVLKMYRAKEITDPSNKIKKLVTEVAHLAGVPTPKAYLINAPYANAFATGRSPKKAAVAVTQGIVDLLSEQELKGVIAHEMAHIKNRDTLISTIAATIAGVISYVAMMARWAAIFGGLGGRDSNGNSNVFEFLALAILTPILATIIQLAISRQREFIADASGASYIHDGLSLASALEKLEQSTKRVSLKPTAQTETTSHLFISNPFRGNPFFNIFATHPPTKERVKRLRSNTF